jgi:hypothetical protein
VGPKRVAALAATDSEPVADAAGASVEDVSGRVERADAVVRTED